MTDRTSPRRTPKQSALWKKNFTRRSKLQRQIRLEAADILQSPNFRSTRAHIQHGTMTVNSHCRNVAECSLAWSRKLPFTVSERELIRGALLHDYFLYDWHIGDYRKPYNLHGYYHPGRALRNAEKEYSLTDTEKEIIKKHMWPLTLVPPMCREAWIVTVADKWCSILETLHIMKGHGAIRESVENYSIGENQNEQ